MANITRVMSLLTTIMLVTGETGDNFPSIRTLAKSDASDFSSIPQPSLDLDPTSLLENSPMIMALPNLQSNLEETDFSKNFPMDFTITQPQLDLVPSFTIHDEDSKKETDTSALNIKRSKREASEFPSIFSIMSSKPNFKINFPTPDLTPGLASFGSGGHKRESRHITEKRQIGFRPSSQLFSSRRPQQHRVTFNDLEEFRSLVRRPVRQGPVYPPFDPFNTTYIPLPGPSSPHYALRLQTDNPHMNEKARFVRFRRPIRQSRFLSQPKEVLPKMFQDQLFNRNNEAVKDPFRYSSSGEFEKHSRPFKSFLFNTP